MDRFFTKLALISVFAANFLFNAHAAKISNLTVKALPPGTPVVAAYFKIENNSNESIDLTAVSGGISNNIEIHEHRHIDGMMKMRQVEKVTVDAKQTVIFKQGGLHLMVFNPQPLKVGEHFELTFKFSDGSTQTAHGTVTSLLEKDNEKPSKDKHHHHH